jgi:hypothetical protein
MRAVKNLKGCVWLDSPSSLPIYIYIYLYIYIYIYFFFFSFSSFTYCLIHPLPSIFKLSFSYLFLLAKDDNCLMNYWGQLLAPLKNMRWVGGWRFWCKAYKNKIKLKPKAGWWRLFCLLLWCLLESLSSERLPRMIHHHSLLYTFQLASIYILKDKGVHFISQSFENNK